MPVTRHPLLPQTNNDLVIAVDEQALGRLESSLTTLKAKGPAIAHRFYTRLFESYPGVRSMFPPDIEAQEKKLLDSLITVVMLLKDPIKVVPMLRDLGHRHTKYGAKPEHYPIVCGLLLESMKAEFGAEWTQQLALEWTQTLELVSHHMKSADIPAKPDTLRTNTHTRTM